MSLQIPSPASPHSSLVRCLTDVLTEIQTIKCELFTYFLSSNISICMRFPTYIFIISSQCQEGMSLLPLQCLNTNFSPLLSPYHVYLPCLQLFSLCLLLFPTLHPIIMLKFQFGDGHLLLLVY